MQMPKNLGCSRPGRATVDVRMIYISADPFISPRDFSFRRPMRRGICREFQAFAASLAAAAHKKRGVSELIIAQQRAIFGVNYKNRRRRGRGERA